MGVNIPFIVVVCLIVLATIGFVLLVICKDKVEKIKNRIKEESKRLEKQSEINKVYSFPAVPCEKMVVSCRNKRQFDYFDPDLYFKGYLNEEKLTDYSLKCSTAEKNEAEYKKYVQELSQIPPTEYEKKRWIKWERKEYEKRIKKLLVDYTVTIRWTYRSPQGRNYYSRHSIFSKEHVNWLLNVWTREMEEKETRQAQIARERAAMSPSLRYKVLKRDGYRCRICGSTAADGVKLEVDHIYPVSLGGKTELSNLQTLCERCNRGKSNNV